MPCLSIYQMGCQVSRLEQGEEDEPARPGLLRRFEDITWLRGAEGIQKSTHSRKQLIEKGAGEDEDEGEGSIPQRDDKIGLVKAPSLDKENLKTLGSGEEEEEEKERDKGMVENGNDGVNQDDGLRFSGWEDYLLGPRSPSFREYCINRHSRDLDKDRNDDVDGDEKQSQRKKKGAPPPPPPPNPNEGCRKKLSKKWSKRRSLRKALKKEGSIKNLWRVSSCYNLGLSSSDDRPPMDGAKSS